VTALLDLLPQQQQQQQHQTEVHQVRVLCTEAMLKAASAMLHQKDTAVKLQLAQLCVATGLLDSIFAAMSTTNAQLQAADAEVAAALAAGRGLPAQYRPQQRDVPLPARLASVLAGVFHSLGTCWPGPLLLSAQAGKIVLPATQLLLVAMRLALRLLAGGNRELSCKLLGSCLRPAVGVALLVVAKVGALEEPAAVRLLRRPELPQLQLLLLTLGIKVRCNEQHVPGRMPSSSSSSSQRQQQQHQYVKLDLIRHKRLLAMLQEWGLSGQQAAAPLPEVLAEAGTPIIDSEIFKHIAERFRCSTTVVQQYLGMGRYQVSEPAAAMQVEQRAAYRQLLHITQTGSLMLLEAAHSLLECEPQLAADASGAAVACTLSVLLRSTGVNTCSSSSTATLEEAHDSDRTEMSAAADGAGGAHGAASGSISSTTGSGSSSSIHVEVTDFEVAQVVKLVSGYSHLQCVSSSTQLATSRVTLLPWACS
jgi:hypothetical protein